MGFAQCRRPQIRTTTMLTAPALNRLPSFKYRQGQLSIMQGCIRVLIKGCEDVELIWESCGSSWRSFWVMCLPHRACGHALGAGLASRKHFASMFDTFGVHLGANWTFWGSFWYHFGVILVSCWCHFGVILMSWFTPGVPPGRLLGLRSLFNFFLITFGTILGHILGSFGGLPEPLTPSD